MESISLEEIVARVNWAANQPLPEKAELQQMVLDILENPHDMPPEQKALSGIHRGDVGYEGIQEYLPFREMYEPWNLPKDRLVPQDEIQLKLHHALITVPKRDKVTEELENGLMTSPPSFEASDTT